MQNNLNAEELLKFQLSKDVVYLYKRFLTEIEDLRNRHIFMLEKLEKELPQEYHKILRAANYFDDDEFSYHRKKVLDAGNETKRNVVDQLKQFEIGFKLPE